MTGAARHDAAPAIAFDPVERSVLVTGATGFIGQTLVRALLGDGHRVVALTRDKERATRLFDGQVHAIAAMSELPPAHPVDIVINLAGSRILGQHWTARRRQALRRSRAGLTDGVVGWIARAHRKPRLLLSASAIGYYGVQPQGDATPLDESAPPQPVFMSDLCREWEAAAGAAAQHGVRVECMRFGLVLGRQGALPMLLLPIRLGLGGPLGGGRQWLSWIHVDDVVGAIAHRWRHGLAPGVAPGIGASNFSAPEQLTQADFSRVAARVLRRPWWLPTPGWPMRLILGAQADLLLEGQRVAPARLLREGFVFRYPDLASALRSLR